MMSDAGSWFLYSCKKHFTWTMVPDPTVKKKTTYGIVIFMQQFRDEVIAFPSNNLFCPSLIERFITLDPVKFNLINIVVVKLSELC